MLKTTVDKTSEANKKSAEQFGYVISKWAMENEIEPADMLAALSLAGDRMVETFTLLNFELTLVE